MDVIMLSPCSYCSLECFRTLVVRIWFGLPPFQLLVFLDFNICQFWEIPRKLSFSKNSKNPILIFSGIFEAERYWGATGGGHTHARRAWPPGRAWAWCGPALAPLSLSLHSFSSSSTENISSKLKPEPCCPEFAIFRSPYSAHHFCWDLELLIFGMWLLRLSN